MDWLTSNLDKVILLVIAGLNAWSVMKLNGMSISTAVTQTTAEASHQAILATQKNVQLIEKATNSLQTKAEAGARAQGNLEGRSEQTAEAKAKGK